MRRGRCRRERPGRVGRDELDVDRPRPDRRDAPPASGSARMPSTIASSASVREAQVEEARRGDLGGLDRGRRAPASLRRPGRAWRRGAWRSPAAGMRYGRASFIARFVARSPWSGFGRVARLRRRGGHRPPAPAERHRRPPRAHARSTASRTWVRMRERSHGRPRPARLAVRARTTAGPGSTRPGVPGGPFVAGSSTKSGRPGRSRRERCGRPAPEVLDRAGPSCEYPALLVRCTDTFGGSHRSERHPSEASASASGTCHMYVYTFSARTRLARRLVVAGRHLRDGLAALFAPAPRPSSRPAPVTTGAAGRTAGPSRRRRSAAAPRPSPAARP